MIHSEYNRNSRQIWRANNREKIRVSNRNSQRIWRAKNPEKIRIYQRNYQKIWRKNNPEKVRAIDKKNRSRHRLEMIARTRAWQKKNPDKVRVINARWRERVKTDLMTWSKSRRSLLRNRCKKDGLPFSLTAEDIFSVIPKDGLCPVLGMPLVFEGLKRNSATVDRFVPLKGYVRGNICVISCRANIMKFDSTDPSELRRIANYMESHLSTSLRLSAVTKLKSPTYPA